MDFSVYLFTCKRKVAYRHKTSYNKELDKLRTIFTLKKLAFDRLLLMCNATLYFTWQVYARNTLWNIKVAIYSLLYRYIDVNCRSYSGWRGIGYSSCYGIDCEPLLWVFMAVVGLVKWMAFCSIHLAEKFHLNRVIVLLYRSQIRVDARNKSSANCVTPPTKHQCECKQCYKIVKLLKLERVFCLCEAVL